MRLRRTRDPVRKRRRTLSGRGQKGFVLIELLVSIAIFGVISVGFLSALVAGYHGVIVAHDQTMAESLTRTTFENVRSAPFPIVDYQTPASKYDVFVDAGYVTYDVVPDAEDITTDDYEVTSDPGYFQMITVTVKYHGSGRTILETQMTKVGV